jgi:hypothetical protein
MAPPGGSVTTLFAATIRWSSTISFSRTGPDDLRLIATYLRRGGLIEGNISRVWIHQNARYRTLDAQLDGPPGTAQPPGTPVRPGLSTHL